ncbi:hypothetical protein GCM10023149_33600 [Mucilaginibacter gynuensis]|uniref:Uncharacterized protein n=1 Tax=Mucilaginibacter gynuensis TaxID=1302236 RepID=A0ABP8GSP2_9SPHI
MEPTELRIGNIVQLHGDPFYADIDTLGNASGEPVILNDQWLQMLGFYVVVLNDGDSPIYHKHGLEIYIDCETLQPMFYGFQVCNYRIQYVHQLQNLYFALTGEELTIMAM